MVKKIFFFIFAVLTVVCLAMTILAVISTIEEFDRVDLQPSPSGVDYLAADMMKSEAIILGFLTVFNAFVSLILGFTVKRKK